MSGQDPMDKSDQAKITRNLRAIKERVEGDLDYIIDRLIEKDILSIQAKEEIDGAQPSTPQNKATLFIHKLLRSGKQSYPLFKEILLERRYGDIVDLMEKTGLETTSSAGASGWTEDRGKTFVISSPSGEASGSSEGKQNGISPDMEHMLAVCMSKFETQIKADLREEFERKIETTKKEQDDTLKLLREDISNLARISEDYERLKKTQEALKKQLNEQHEKILKLNQENIQLKADVTKMDSMTEENATLTVENETLKEENKKLENQVKELEGHVLDKEKEIEKLKLHIEVRYSQLKTDMTKTFENDQRLCLHEDIQKQQNMLSEISKAVSAITKTMELQNNSMARNKRGPWIPAKATPRSLYNKPAGYLSGKRK